MINFAGISAAASAVAHSQQVLHANPLLPDPIGPVLHPGDKVALNPQPLPPRDTLFGALTHRFDGVALNPQPLPPRDAMLGGLSQRGSIAAIRATLDQAQLRPAHGIDKALIGALFPPAPDPLGHRRSINVFSDAGLNTPPATTQTLFVKGAGDVDAVSINDIDQEQVGDCFLLGSLAAVARQDPQRIRDMVVDNGNGTYTVTFQEQRWVGVGFGARLEYVGVPITVAADFPGGLAGNGHAKPGDTGWGTVEIWPLVVEKAYGQYLTCQDPYAALDRGGSSRHLLEMLTGRPAASTGFRLGGLGGPETFDTMLADFQAGKAITVCTDAKDGTLVKDHCYAVSNVYCDASGKQWVELYNPWGHDHATLPFDEVRQREIYTA